MDAALVHLASATHRRVTVRNRQVVEKVFSRTVSATLTVFHDGRRASATSSDFSNEGLRRLAAAARDIARVTAVDPSSGLGDEAQLASEMRDLALCHPWEVSTSECIDLAARAEDSAFAVDPCITQTEGGRVFSVTGQTLLANSGGFLGSYPWSMHGLSCTPVAMAGGKKQLDGWGDAVRDPGALATPESIGRIAAERARDGLAARQISTRKCPVLFDPSTARSLLSECVSALSGDALYRNASFLLESHGECVFPTHITLTEDPYLRAGNASAPFDSDGIAGVARQVVDGGRIEGFFLSLYAARRLGREPTGNGNGPYNLRFVSSQTRPDDTLEAMLRKLDRGLFVTSMVGGGVDKLSGDFSRAVRGFWIENGIIQYPVAGVTLASNLKTMFSGLDCVGADELTSGALSTGSWLINSMMLGGV